MRGDYKVVLKTLLSFLNRLRPIALLSDFKGSSGPVKAFFQVLSEYWVHFATASGYLMAYKAVLNHKITQSSNE